jgi:hypothetical protein
VNDEPMREAFEKWAESEGYDVSVSKSVPAYGYLNTNTREAFEGWQAACKWKNTRAQASATEGDSLVWHNPAPHAAAPSVPSTKTVTVRLGDTRSNAKAREVESINASDEDIRAWADRHDLALSITSAREAFEDAATAHLLDNSTQRGDKEK